MRAVDLIRTKRDGGELEPQVIKDLIQGYLQGQVADAQMSAFCMAVFFKGMTDREASALVEAMLHSGDVMDLSHVPGRKVDKHSTGGVGDKISICLAPLVAACGVAVPMISGRGLGHTGGTLDKLGAIPGFRTDLDADRFGSLVQTHGMALIGQTENLAPADRRLYALRDVTATVESIPLIAASIMSKKLAEGIDGLVLDVKVGSGAFMKTREDAEALAEALVGVGQRGGKSTCALLTDMSQVLGAAVGNANETWEALDVLRDGGPPDVRELTLRLGEEMLRLGGVATTASEARTQLESALASGAAFRKMEAIVEAQGGDPRALSDRSLMASANGTERVVAAKAGYVREMDTEAVGRAAMLLGAGRALATDEIDPGVGLTVHVRLGDEVEAGTPLVDVHHRDGRGVDAARALLSDGMTIGEARTPPPLVLGRVGEGWS